MIIVSQDRRMIINFENIVGVLIRKNVKEDIYQIQCKSENEKNARIIGKYKTEERAKEILQEIYEFYEIAKRFECSSNNGVTIFTEPRFAYSMPEE